MPFYRFTTSNSVPLIFQATSATAATAKAQKDHWQGCEVEALTVTDMVAMQSSGLRLPVAARGLVAAYRAKEATARAKVQGKAAQQAKVKQAKQDAREKVREEAKAARQAVLDQQRAAALAEKKREARRAKKTEQAAKFAPLLECEAGEVPW